MATPGITIRDRLRVLLPNDPESYYASRELVPTDMLADLGRAEIFVANQGLGFAVPYRMGGEARTYVPDFIVRVDDGHGADDPLNLVVEVKGYRREDAKAKKQTMETYCHLPSCSKDRSDHRMHVEVITDLTVGDLIDFKKKILTVNHEYQRGLRWTDLQKRMVVRGSCLQKARTSDSTIGKRRTPA